MEEDGIGLVLARAYELRMKFTNCIQKATRSDLNGEERGAEDKEGSVEADDEEAESLLNIRDALESLESQLSSLQAMQQQQRYEREAALAEIEYSREVLLKKLKEYKGEDLEVIKEASTFASETVEHNNDLLLPPYPVRPPHSINLDNNGYITQNPYRRKFYRNGFSDSDPSNEANQNLRELERTNGLKGLRGFINTATKAVITLVGVISVLSLAGFEPRLRRKDNNNNYNNNTFLGIFGLFQQKGVEENRLAANECPPGKILVVENGETRCLVKERVEVPFESVVAKPDVSYGCG